MQIFVDAKLPTADICSIFFNAGVVVDFGFCGKVCFQTYCAGHWVAKMHDSQSTTLVRDLLTNDM